MRVLHLYAGNLFGGIETLLIALAKERRLCPEMEPEFGLCFDGRLSDELRACGVSVHQLGNVRFSRPWTVWKARRLLGQLLTADPPDAVVTHACWPHSVFAPTVRRARIPLIFWAHDVAHPEHWLDRKASRLPPDRIIANSHFTASSVVKVFAGSPVEVIYPPVHATVGDPSRRVALRQELVTVSDSVVILMACRMEDWKGHRLLLQALGLLKNDARWTCWIAGGAQRLEESEYLQRLRALESAHSLGGRIRWLGQRQDVADLLVAADIYCQPNLGPEPFGIVFVEALFAGRPVISTAHGGVTEIINEECGVLVRPGSVDDLSRAITRLIDSSDLRSSLGRAGPDRARQLCDPVECQSRLMRWIAR